MEGRRRADRERAANGGEREKDLFCSGSGPNRPKRRTRSAFARAVWEGGARPTAMSLCPREKGRRVLRSHLSSSSARKLNHAQQLPRRRGSALALRPQRLPSPLFPLLAHGSKLFNQDQRPPQKWRRAARKRRQKNPKRRRAAPPRCPSSRPNSTAAECR